MLLLTFAVRVCSESDRSDVFIDFEIFYGAMALVYFAGARPTDSTGSPPAILPTESFDGDNSSYSPSIVRGIKSEWYTFDVGVPVPTDVAASIRLRTLQFRRHAV